MSTSDPTPLAKRLCQAAWLEMRGPAWSNWDYAELETTASSSARMDCKARVDRTVVAVLRELAEDTRYMRRDQDGDWLSLARIRSLADSIERGEG